MGLGSRSLGCLQGTAVLSSVTALALASWLRAHQVHVSLEGTHITLSEPEAWERLCPSGLHSLEGRRDKPPVLSIVFIEYSPIGCRLEAGLMGTSAHRWC